MMYHKTVALNRTIHADLTISPSPNGFRFATDLLSVMLAASEFYDASRQYPIVFTISPEKRVQPVVLLGFQEGENLFVDKDGKWEGRYIPAFLRRYPFITTDENSDGQATVCFDETFDGFNRHGGTPLFRNGEPTEKMVEIQNFLQNYLLLLKQTWVFGDMLLEKELLREISAKANLVNGKMYGLNGMYVVDEKKLSGLSDEEVTKMFRDGSLPLVYAHLLSLRNLPELADRKGNKSMSQERG
jgi:hypothetical protein